MDCLHDRLDAAELDPRSAARALGIEAAALFFFDQQVEGGVDFFVEVAIDAVAVEEISEEGG